MSLIDDETSGVQCAALHVVDSRLIRRSGVKARQGVGSRPLYRKQTV